MMPLKKNIVLVFALGVMFAPLQALAITGSEGQFFAISPTDDMRVQPATTVALMPKFLPIQPQMRASPQPVKLVPLPAAVKPAEPQKKAESTMSDEQAKLLLFIFNQSE